MTNQKMTWKKVEEIGDKEGRVDVGIAAAGIMYGAPALEQSGGRVSESGVAFGARRSMLVLTGL